uniref:Uncharacterized protein n=1 Tax=Coccidioides posadasii RMSCC 3488 TaxID=454284 RepID=A0A0J6FIX7_COCPO|nr:hypothetical protein CPAG_05113 [Coccidioides posadasii RMSCC 3488]
MFLKDPTRKLIDRIRKLHDKDVRIREYADPVTGSSLNLHIETWDDSILYSGSAIWFGADSNTDEFPTGSYNTLNDDKLDSLNVKSHSKEVKFRNQFEEMPTLVA